MDLKFNENNQLRVRLAILESQLKCAKNQIKALSKKNIAPQTKPDQPK